MMMRSRTMENEKRGDEICWRSKKSKANDEYYIVYQIIYINLV